MNSYISTIINEVIKPKSDKKTISGPFNPDEFFEKSKEEEIDEIVDKNGDIMRSKIPTNSKTKYITQKKTTDDVVATSTGAMGNVTPRGSRRFWGEGKILTKKQITEIDLDKNLGAEETILKDVPFDKALNYFMDVLKLDKETALEKMKNLGYDKDLPNGKFNLVEKKYLEELIDSLINKKTEPNDIIAKEIDKMELDNKQKKLLLTLKKYVKSNKLTINQINSFLKNE